MFLIGRKWKWTIRVWVWLGIASIRIRGIISGIAWCIPKVVCVARIGVIILVTMTTTASADCFSEYFKHSRLIYSLLLNFLSYFFLFFMYHCLSLCISLTRIYKNIYYILHIEKQTKKFLKESAIRTRKFEINNKKFSSRWRINVSTPIIKYTCW